MRWDFLILSFNNNFFFCGGDWGLWVYYIWSVVLDSCPLHTLYDLPPMFFRVGFMRLLNCKSLFRIYWKSTLDCMESLLCFGFSALGLDRNISLKWTLVWTLAIYTLAHTVKNVILNLYILLKSTASKCRKCRFRGPKFKIFPGGLPPDPIQMCRHCLIT